MQIATDGNGGTDIWLEPIPVVGAGGAVNFTGGGAPIALDGTATVTDTASTTLVGATIDINSGFVPGDRLNFTNTASISGSSTR